MIVKICGLTRNEDVELALAEGADLVGFVREPTSFRFLPDETFRELIVGRPSVAVYGPMYDDPLAKLATKIQAYGAGDLPVYRHPPGAKIDDFQVWLELHPNPTIVLDAYSAQAYGGSGHAWNLDLAVELSEIAQRDIILAGGLTAETVEEAIDKVRPYGVDVSSGIEKMPGIKDHEALKRFINTAKKWRER